MPAGCEEEWCRSFLPPPHSAGKPSADSGRRNSRGVGVKCEKQNNIVLYESKNSPIMRSQRLNKNVGDRAMVGRVGPTIAEEGESPHQ